MTTGSVEQSSSTNSNIVQNNESSMNNVCERLIQLSFSKIANSKNERGGAKLRKNLLIIHLLHRARVEQFTQLDTTETQFTSEENSNCSKNDKMDAETSTDDENEPHEPTVTGYASNSDKNLLDTSMMITEIDILDLSTTTSNENGSFTGLEALDTSATIVAMKSATGCVDVETHCDASATSVVMEFTTGCVNLEVHCDASATSVVMESTTACANLEAHCDASATSVAMESTTGCANLEVHCDASATSIAVESTTGCANLEAHCDASATSVTMESATVGLDLRNDSDKSAAVESPTVRVDLETRCDASATSDIGFKPKCATSERFWMLDYTEPINMCGNDDVTTKASDLSSDDDDDESQSSSSSSNSDEEEYSTAAPASDSGRKRKMSASSSNNNELAIMMKKRREVLAPKNPSQEQLQGLIDVFKTGLKGVGSNNNNVNSKNDESSMTSQNVEGATVAMFPKNSVAAQSLALTCVS